MDVNPTMSVAEFFQSISKRIDGVLLIALILLNWTFAVFPRVTVALGLVRDHEGALNMRLAFLVMPLALVGVYVWFLSSVCKKRHSVLLCAVLLATAAIPFFKILKDAIQ